MTTTKANGMQYCPLPLWEGEGEREREREKEEGREKGRERERGRGLERERERGGIYYVHVYVNLRDVTLTNPVVLFTISLGSPADNSTSTVSTCPRLLARANAVRLFCTYQGR